VANKAKLEIKPCCMERVGSEEQKKLARIFIAINTLWPVTRCDLCAHCFHLSLNRFPAVAVQY